MRRLIDADLLYMQLQKDEELARKRVLDTESFLPYPNNMNPSYTRYVAQMDERTRLKHMVADAPTIEPERWIPCSKTTDIPDHEIMACDEYGEIMFGYLAYEDDQWICASDGYEMVDPIAWREKPEPWRKEGE